MSKNVVIAIDGTSTTLQNVEKLVTDLPGGGTCNWIPEDEAGGTLITKSITQNGTYNASDDSADGYSSVTVNVSGGGSSGVYKGTAAPDSSLGSDGDVYVRVYEKPSGVTFVEYLEGTGTQYIDTGLTATEKTQADVKAYRAASSGFLFGARQARNNSAFCITNTASGTVRYDYGSGERSVGSANSLSVFEMSGSRFPESTFTTPVSMALFGGNTPSGVSGIAAAKIYRARFFEDGVLAGDFLPALDSDSVPCMADLVSGNLFYNQGSGDFSYGSSITPADAPPTVYIKISGTWTATGWRYGL